MSDDAAIKRLKSVLALQKAAFLKNQCPSVEERKANIGKIPQMVLSRRDAIREAIHKDFGSHPTSATDLIEVLGVAGRAAYVMSKIEEWTAVDSREVDPQMFGSAKGEVRYQPKGVIGNIVRMSTLIVSLEMILTGSKRGTSLLTSLSDRCVRCSQLATG